MLGIEMCHDFKKTERVLQKYLVWINRPVNQFSFWIWQSNWVQIYSIEGANYIPLTYND